MHMMMSQPFKFAEFTETKKPRYLEKETFFLETKKSLIKNQGLLYADGKK